MDLVSLLTFLFTAVPVIGEVLKNKFFFFSIDLSFDVSVCNWYLTSEGLKARDSSVIF